MIRPEFAEEADGRAGGRNPTVVDRVRRVMAIGRTATRIGVVVAFAGALRTR
ncbi:hypothetical protein GCM10027615_59640 [Plantactinospora veratri]